MPGIASVINRSPRRSLSIPTHRASSFDSYLAIPKMRNPQIVTEDDIILREIILVLFFLGSRKGVCKLQLRRQDVSSTLS